MMQLLFLLILCAILNQTSSSTYYCNDPGTPSNGYRNGNNFAIGKSVTFGCDENYQLFGEQTITCIQDKNYVDWSDYTPVCLEIYESTKKTPRCGKAPKTGRHATKLAISTKTILRYECENDEKYIYDKGDHIVQCIDNKWIGKPLECRRKAKCSDQTVSSNTYITSTGSYEGDTVTFSCSTGHVLSSNIDKVTCTSTGDWSLSPWPACQAVNCGLPPSLSHAISKYTSTLFQSVVTYNCFKGYHQIGPNTITCLKSGKWSHLLVRCEIVSCPIPIQPSNGRAYYTSAVYNSTASYRCTTGYVLNGTSQRRCREDGSWYPMPPTCQPVQCGPPPNPVNGIVQFGPTDYKSISTYFCNVGYKLEGSKSRRCGSDGNWSRAPPICSPVDCGSNLPSPKNGTISIDTTTFGSKVTYTCSNGLIIIGNDTRLCQADKTWSGKTPSCVTAFDINCGSLSPPKNGFVRYNSTHYDSIATYTCQKGFNLIGTAIRTCQKNRQWSESSPTCQEIQCSVLSNPIHGYVSLINRSIGGIASYTCERGYTLEGDKTRQCTHDKTWSGMEPSCIIVDCLLPPTLTNGSVYINGTTYNSIAVYECKSGLTLIGPSQRKCQANKQWSGDQSYCLLDCGPLQSGPNGRVTYLTNTTVVGTVAQYTCISGYTLVGSNQSLCREDGLWSNTDQECEPVDCGPLTPPENGEIFVFNTTLASPARYSCNIGFELSGFEIRVCTINGTWSRLAPTCKIIDCGNLTNPENGIVSMTGTIFTSSANYSCFPGYNLSEPVIRFCTITGQWSGNEPSCDPVDCGPLTPPENGEIFVFNTTLASPARYSCNIGFELSGFEIRVCTINGTWSGLAPTCNVVDCGAPPTPSNGRVEFRETLFTSRANYSCNEGYTLEGSSVRFCTDIGTWSGSDPTCNPISCGIPNEITNGQVFFNGTTLTSRAVYSCNYGYRIQGTNFQFCRANGSWNGSTPTCELTDCGDPGRPRNGYRSFLSTFIDAVVTYTCPTNLQLYGNRIRRCQHNGLWSGEVPSCGPISCGDPGRLINGLRFFFGTTVGEVVTFSCKTGFVLQGDPSRQCKSNGVWSGIVPTCLDVRPRCPDPGTPANGSRTLTGLTPSSTVRYSCAKGHRLIGNVVRHCSDDGTWTNNLPRCERITSCTDPGTPLNGRRINNDFRIGSLVYYVCDDGFDISGSSGRQCQYTGQWTGTMATCIQRNLSCDSNGTVFDSIGRRCTCVGRQMINCSRYRQDWLNLSNQQRIHYVRAVLNVSSNPIYQPLYRTLMQQYFNSSRTLAQSLDSSSTQFLPWHRFYLHQYEDLLRMVDPTVTIPYWDWTLLPQTPYQSTVFSSTEGFGNSSDPSTSCVNNGPFRSGQFSLALKDSCLKRRYGDTTASLLTQSQLEDIILSQPSSSFSQFFSLLTLPYITVRCTIGGTICDVRNSPPTEDPLQLLILSFVDSIWSRWQSVSIEHKLAKYSSDDTVLTMTNGVKVSDYHDSGSLPYGVSILYDIPAGMSARHARSVTSDNVISCPLKEWMVKLGLSNSQQSVMKAACRLLYVL